MPEIILTTEDLPELADWQEGETYRIIMEVTPTSIADDEATLEIASVRAVPMKKTEPETVLEPEAEPEEEMGQESTREKVIERIGEKAKEV